MVKTDLDAPDAGRWRLVMELYRLKSEPRRGWLARNLQAKFEIGRVESVAEHSLLAVLLATLLLPRTFPAVPEYDKDEVVRILAVHDVAEAFTGDIIFRRLARESLEQGRRLEDRVQSYLKWQETYDGIYESDLLYERCKSITRVEKIERSAHRRGSTVDLNGAIARDIDKLENLLQLYIYRDQYPEWLSPLDFTGFATSLQSEMRTMIIGGIAKEFVHWAEAHRGRLQRERPIFFDPTLLERQDSVVKAPRR
jgi:5'-deoxynucleotidase YfbR-like HD superfamily hydrolase